MSEPRAARAGAVLVLGCGFFGQVLAQRLAFRGIPVIGTARGEPQIGIIRTRGAEAVRFDAREGPAALGAIARLSGRVRAVVMSIPPDAAAPALDAELVALLAGFGLETAVYISSTSVYGDHAGAVVTETTPCTPDSPKARLRVASEAAWRAAPFPVGVVRPSGIYGPGRSLLHRMAQRTYRVVDVPAGSPEPLTNRVHVADLASIVQAALKPRPAGNDAPVYLATDQTPATQREVTAWVVAELGLPEPAHLSLAEARVRMDKDQLAMAVQSKRLDPMWTLSTLGVTLKYPSFREGFRDLWDKERSSLTPAPVAG